jgi:hypothetical protein
MNTLKSNKDKLFNLKENITNSTFYTRHTLNNCKLSENTVSIIMTSSNRSKQTYFTLNTFLRNNHKDIQVILVDDSTSDPIDINVLKNFPFTIEFIAINRTNKNWHNPCVNYNIGFNYVLGSKIIIQNAEVCHVGNVIDYVVENINNNNVYVPFDVPTVNNLESNEIIYRTNTENINIYSMTHLFGVWYQSAYERDRGLHFLIAMTRNVFDRVNGFSYDYTFGSWYDDDDYVLKLQANNVSKASIGYKEAKCGGIHLWHIRSEETWEKGIVKNEDLFKKKKKHYENTGKYIEISDNIVDFEKNLDILNSVQI